MRAERLQNGYVRVDDTSGLVRVWELLRTGRLVLRSGQGYVTDTERRLVLAAFFPAA